MGNTHTFTTLKVGPIGAGHRDCVELGSDHSENIFIDCQVSSKYRKSLAMYPELLFKPTHVLEPSQIPLSPTLKAESTYMFPSTNIYFKLDLQKNQSILPLTAVIKVRYLYELPNGAEGFASLRLWLWISKYWPMEQFVEYFSEPFGLSVSHSELVPEPYFLRDYQHFSGVWIWNQHSWHTD